MDLSHIGYEIMVIWYEGVNELRIG